MHDIPLSFLHCKLYSVVRAGNVRSACRRIWPQERRRRSRLLCIFTTVRSARCPTAARRQDPSCTWLFSSELLVSRRSSFSLQQQSSLDEFIKTIVRSHSSEISETKKWYPYHAGREVCGMRIKTVPCPSVRPSVRLSRRSIAATWQHRPAGLPQSWRGTFGSMPRGKRKFRSNYKDNWHIVFKTNLIRLFLQTFLFAEASL